MKRITLWVPAAEDPKWPCVESLFHVRLPDGYELMFERSAADGDGINGAWNRLVKSFLKSDSEWLFSVHNDITFLPGTLVRLMSWNEPLVSALVFHKTAPCAPMIYRGRVPGGNGHGYKVLFRETRAWLMEHPELGRPGPAMMESAPREALWPIDFCSTGCVVIHRDVLQAIEPPWFVWEAEALGGEDRVFFEKAAEAGFQPKMDLSVVAGHGVPPVGALHWIAWDKISVYEPESSER